MKSVEVVVWLFASIVFLTANALSFWNHFFGGK